ncbi:MAG: hypothetical protein JWN73_3624 [Betaproteobacteria bacterium]|nr:hypothetical protein [Betaproteobacteria bacterium]
MLPVMLPGLACAALPLGLFVSGGSPALVSPPGTFARGDEVTIISLPDFAVHCCASVGGAATLGGNAQSSEVDHSAGFALRAQGLTGTTADAAPAVVIKGKPVAKKTKAGLLIDLDGDGKPELLKACPSSEGIHVTAWRGKQRVWHAYMYLGVDMESACTAAETR